MQRESIAKRECVNVEFGVGVRTRISGGMGDDLSIEKQAVRDAVSCGSKKQ